MTRHHTGHQSQKCCFPHQLELWQVEPDAALTLASMLGVMEVGNAVHIPEYTGAWVYHFTRSDSSKCQSENTAVKNPELVLLLLVFSFALMLAEEFNETSNFMCSLEKNGK